MTQSTPFPRPRQSTPAKEMPHERRGKVTYKLAVFDARSFCFRDGKVAYESEWEACAAAKSPGKYRISRIVAGGERTDLEPFSI